MLTDKELVDLISRLDVITVAIHQPDVAHIGLISCPKDILALDAHVMEVADLRRKVEALKDSDQATSRPRSATSVHHRSLG